MTQRELAAIYLYSLPVAPISYSTVPRTLLPKVPGPLRPRILSPSPKSPGGSLEPWRRALGCDLRFFGASALVYAGLWAPNAPRRRSLWGWSEQTMEGSWQSCPICRAIWWFPKIRGPFLGVFILGIMVYWGLFWGPYLGKLPYVYIVGSAQAQ